MVEISELSVNWHVVEPVRFWTTAILYGLIIRIIMSALQAVKSAHEEDGQLWTFCRFWWYGFRGYHPRVDIHKTQGSEIKKLKNSSNYWFTFVLGLFELSSYSVCIAIKAWPAIGAWFTLKTLSQWDIWKDDRAIFNLFLIGNILVFSVSYFVLVRFISL